MAVALRALLLFNLVGLVVYNFLAYRLQFHSDAAVKNVFAEQVLRSGSLIPSDWVYVHGEIMVFFGHLFIAPLLPFFDNGFALHAVAGVAIAALLLVSLWSVTGLLSLSTPIRLLGVCLVSSGISFYFAENYFGQAAYGSVAVLLLVHIGLAIVAFDAGRGPDVGRRWGISLALAVVAFVSFLANLERALVTYVVPMAVTVATLLAPRGRGWMASHAVSARPSILWPAGGYALGAVLGVALHVYALKNAATMGTHAKRAFVPLSALSERANLAAESILFLFGASGREGDSVIGLSGVSVALHLLLASSVIATGVLLARGGQRHVRPSLVALNNAFLTSLLATAFLYVFTNLAEDLSTSRYFVPAFTLGFISLLGFIDHNVVRGRPGFWTLVALTSVLGVAATSYQVFYAPLYAHIRANGYALELPRGPSEALIAFLEKNALTYGYASYWNSHVNTVLSGGKVKIRPVVFATLPRAMLQLSAPSWYLPSSHIGPVFLLVSASDAKAFDAGEMERAAGAPRTVLTYGEFTIYVYASHFGASVFGWDPEVRNPSTMRVSSKTPHTIGRYIDDRLLGGWMESTAGQSGALVHGPYISLHKGRYVADFEVSGCFLDAQSLGHVDVTGFRNGQATQLSKRDIRLNEEWTRQSVPFDLSENTDGMEFRVMASGAGCLRARSVTIRRNG